jgi:hypothetical protein
MSRIIANNNKNFNNNNNNNTNKKPFCKVCADAGKTDTAHFVRLNASPDAPVTCPTLLALQCRYCDKSGHTVKYCPTLKKNNKDLAKRTVVAPPVIAKPTKKETNKFAALMEDSDDEDMSNQVQVNGQVEAAPTGEDYYPELATRTNYAAPAVSWASRAAAVAHIAQPISAPTTAAVYEQMYDSINIDDYDLEPPQYDDNDLEEAYQEVRAVDYTEQNLAKRALWIDEEW